MLLKGFLNLLLHYHLTPFLSTQRDLQAQQPAHKSGCKCRKSMCLKKYCECFEASLPCSSTCTCVDCHNTINDMSRNAERLSLVENADMEVVPVQATRYYIAKVINAPSSINPQYNISAIFEDIIELLHDARAGQPFNECPAKKAPPH